MIVTSAALVVMAIAMLIWGIVAEQLTAVYASVGISVISAVLLAVGVYLRRRELFGDAARSGATMAPHGAAAVGTAGLGKTAVPVGGASPGARRDTAGFTDSGRTGTGFAGAAPARTAPTGVRQERSPAARPADGSAGSPGGDDEETYPVPTGLDVPADAIVHVVPGRRRYHLGSCRQLKGRQSEELTYEEAHEEGFSACTACMPDVALAARAARTPQPRDTPASAPPAVTPTGSTWDGRSVKPGTDDDSGSDSDSGGGTVSPTGSTWDGQSVKPGAGEDEKSDSGTVSPTGSTWDGQSVEQGDDDSAEDDTDSEHTGADAAHEAGKDADAETDTESDAEEDSENNAEEGEASTDADAGGDGEEATGDGGTEATDAEPVQVVQGTKRYHRPECALVNAVPDEEITSMAQARAMEEGYGPCLACEPDKAPAR